MRARPWHYATSIRQERKAFLIRSSCSQKHRVVLEKSELAHDRFKSFRNEGCSLSTKLIMKPVTRIKRQDWLGIRATMLVL